MCVQRVSQEVLVATRVIEADDRGADEPGTTEREEVVGGVVEQHRDMSGCAGRETLEEERREPARLLEVLPVGPGAVAELDRDPIAELLGVAAQECRRVRCDQGCLPGGRHRTPGET